MLTGRLGVNETGLELSIYPTWLMIFGLIGLLFHKWSSPTVIQIPANTISAANQESFGVNKTVLALTLKDGSEHRFVLDSNFETIVTILESLNVAVQCLS